MDDNKWYNTVFNHHYYEVFSLLRPIEFTKCEVNIIEQILRLKKEYKILDLCCGYGRHSIELTKKGYNVIGIDSSKDLLDMAKEEAKSQGLNIEFIQADIRNLSYINEFDIIINNSFGYLENDDEELKALQCIKRALKLNGVFYQWEITNRDQWACTYRSIDTIRVNNTYLIKESSYDPLKSIDSQTFTLFSNGLFRTKHSVQLRLFSLKELKNLHEKAGLTYINHFDITGEDFHANSPELLSAKTIAIMNRTKEFFLTLLLKTGNILPVLIIRPLLKRILCKRSKTNIGYEESCERLIDFDNLLPNIVRIPSKYWQRNPIVRTDALGLKFQLDLRDNSQRCLYFNGRYEPKTLEFICGIIRKDDVFIDIGAHIGIHALVVAKELKKIGGGKVIAFEPTTDSFSLLQYNSSLNQLSIDAFNLALGNKKGKFQIYGDKKWGKYDAAVRSMFGDGEIIQDVDVDTFDNWISNKTISRIDIVKMDVEGAEYNVLKGMLNTLCVMKPRYLILEIKQGLLLKAGIEKDCIFNLMNNLNYINSEAIEDNYIFKNLIYDK